MSRNRISNRSLSLSLSLIRLFKTPKTNTENTNKRSLSLQLSLSLEQKRAKSKEEETTSSESLLTDDFCAVSWLFFENFCKLFRVLKPNFYLKDTRRTFSSNNARERERERDERHGFSQRREGDKDDE